MVVRKYVFQRVVACVVVVVKCSSGFVKRTVLGLAVSGESQYFIDAAHFPRRFFFSSFEATAFYQKQQLYRQPKPALAAGRRPKAYSYEYVSNGSLR